MYRRITYWLANRLWHLRLRAARTLLAPGPRTWEALDRLGVPGFGIDLIRVDFPPDLSCRDAWAGAAALLAPPLDADLAQHLAFLERSLQTAGELASWPVEPDPARPQLPWWRNEFLPAMDMAVLHGVIRERRPARYVEIGSGISTRVAAAARRSGGFTMPIVSIDPEPRIEVAALCDEIHRCRLEEAVEHTLAAVTPQSLLFFDGSHRCFPGSDVTVFFLSVLPRLPRGVLVHVHDIYLPADYPPQFAARYWTEQYLLAAWLLGGGRGLRVLLPNAHVAQTDAGRHLLEAHLPTAARDGRNLGGSSFWFETT